MTGRASPFYILLGFAKHSGLILARPVWPQQARAAPWSGSIWIAHAEKRPAQRTSRRYVGNRMAVFVAPAPLNYAKQAAEKHDILSFRAKRGISPSLFSYS